MRLKAKVTGLALIIMATFAIGYAEICQCVILDENTIACWTFDEGEGDILEDVSENDNNGEIDGAVWIDGKSGKSLEFDGKDDVVKVPDSETLHTMDITITSWVKVYSDPTTWTGTNAAGLVFKLSEYQWVVENTGLLWLGLWGAALRSNFNFTDHPNEWHHVAVTFNDETQESEIYIDGELDAEGIVAESLDPSANTLLIGSKDEQGVEFFHGTIDEMEISSVVRTQEEINASMLAFAVNARGKLAATWGALKRIY